MRACLKTRKILSPALCAVLSIPLFVSISAETVAEKSPYMGGEVNLTKAPNGAVIREEVLTTSSKILYTEPTTEKLADGVWCIGGISLANTTVIEADDGLIVYDTGDTKEEAEHIRAAIGKSATSRSRCSYTATPIMLWEAARLWIIRMMY